METAGNETGSGEVSRLAELRALRAELGFDPFRVIVAECQRKGKSALKPVEKVRAAETIAKLELDYEKLELAKKGGGRGMRVSVGADGSATVDMFDDFAALTDEQLESRIADKVAALGIG